MKLLSLTLRNFKGIRNLSIQTNGGNVDIFGDNATGKTTIFDAFTWLLFDKDSQNRKDFEIKTLDANGQPLHGLDHEVEAVLDIGGRTLTLRKTYKEKWTKKRGSALAEFTGHTTDYYIDGVPVKKGEYEAKIAEIAPEDIFKLLTNPLYFNEQLHWQKRREILLQVCGDISDEEVIASDRSLAKLPEILQGRKLEDHRKIIAARRSEINKELERIPVRSDEAQRALPQITHMSLDIAKLPEDIAKLKALLQEKQQELARIESGGEIAEKRRQLREIEAEILQLKNEQQAKVNKVIDAKRLLLNQAKEGVYVLQSELKHKQLLHHMNEEHIRNLQTKIIQLRETWHQIDGEQFTFEQDSVCPTCGQALPVEQLAAAREKALAQFNFDKANKLTKVTEEGKAAKAELEKFQAENAALETEIADLKQQLAAQEQEAEKLQAEIAKLQGAASTIEDPTLAKKETEKAFLEKVISTLQLGNQETVQKVKQEIAELNNDIATLEEARLKVEQYNQGQKRIEELKALERQLAAEYERLEGELYLCDQFVRTKVNLLEDKINSKFKLARFKMFEIQVNGGVNDQLCETTYNGVPYSGGLNNAAKINVGLDIINTLSEHYGFEAPIFVDNAEAVTQLIETNGQQIRLIVSEADKALRVVAHKELKEAV